MSVQTPCPRKPSVPGPRNLVRVVNPSLARALAALNSAVQGRKISPICSSYEALRAVKDANESQAIHFVQKHLGEMAGDAIVYAYSHRRCFMCEHGILPCDMCGTLAQHGAHCSQCDRLRVIPCGFCGGTSWADRETVPVELTSLVLRQQLDHTLDDLKRFETKAPALTREGISQLPHRGRKELALWLIRLSARLRDLAATDVADEDDNIRLTEAAEDIDPLIILLAR